MKTAVLAYSGGLDTSCMIGWLKEDYGYDEVVAVLVDVGQDANFEPAFARGRAAGADDVVLVDRKEEFADEQVAKTLIANALYENKYPLVSALSRPVIAEAVAEIALGLDAEAVVHGCTGKGNDQVRFELAFKAKYPGVKVIAPLRDNVWTRDAEIAYAESRGIPVEAKQDSPFSIDDNLFGRACEAGILEDPWNAPPEAAYVMTGNPANAPAPDEIVIGFEQGLPVSLDGEELPLWQLILQLNELAGPYGIGRIDMIENRSVGIKSREVYEVPAAISLITSHQALEDLILTKAEAIAKRELEPKWAKLVYDGFWFHPVREAYDAFFAKTQELVTGEVRLRLQASMPAVAGSRSEFALYSESLASYATGETFPHRAAAGLIAITALETELVAARERKTAAV